MVSIAEGAEALRDNDCTCLLTGKMAVEVPSSLKVCCCRRVKSTARFGSEGEDGTTIMIDTGGDDQADRFPYGC